IPLRGFDEKTSAEDAYLTHKESASNAPIVKAMGRKSKADNPLAYLQFMAESTIMQGNRGRSGFVFWNASIQGLTNFGRQFPFE
ncbi:SNF2 family protein, partial [gut metagenome]